MTGAHDGRGTVLRVDLGEGWWVELVGSRTYAHLFVGNDERGTYRRSLCNQVEYTGPKPVAGQRAVCPKCNARMDWLMDLVAWVREDGP